MKIALDKVEGKHLLALSGGPDSIALFFLLLENKLPFEVAHVNHNWRKESRLEAEKLKILCEEKGVVFHYAELPTPTSKRNLEDKGRKSRFAFFKGLVERRGLRAVLMGHHGDDVAETVLKRLFEGAGLTKLQGISELSVIEGITVYRPLINLRKKEILAWLEKRQITYFWDATNEEEDFLRGRMRNKIMPYLSQVFGKEVTPSLLCLAKRATELEAFLDGCIAPYRKTEELDLQTPPSSPFLAKAVIADFFERRQITVSKAAVETIYQHIVNKSCHKKICVGRGVVVIHKGRLTHNKRIDEESVVNV
ncbi:MAG: tRNA lysidine(34) synthetase TilS [Chlamydiales bacterium]